MFKAIEFRGKVGRGLKGFPTSYITKLDPKTTGLGHKVYSYVRFRGY